MNKIEQLRAEKASMMLLTERAKRIVRDHISKTGIKLSYLDYQMGMTLGYTSRFFHRQKPQPSAIIHLSKVVTALAPLVAEAKAQAGRLGTLSGLMGVEKKVRPSKGPPPLFKAPMEYPINQVLNWPPPPDVKPLFRGPRLDQIQAFRRRMFAVEFPVAA